MKFVFFFERSYLSIYVPTIGAMLCRSRLWQKSRQVHQEGPEVAPQQHRQRLRGHHRARAEGHGRAARSGGPGQEGEDGESAADTTGEVRIINPLWKALRALLIFVFRKISF